MASRILNSSSDELSLKNIAQIFGLKLFPLLLLVPFCDGMCTKLFAFCKLQSIKMTGKNASGNAVTVICSFIKKFCSKSHF
jgi:hypothetical protein